MGKQFLLMLLAATAWATPIAERAAAPTVTIKNGTVIGATYDKVDTFLGIPYAQPPTGSNRLRVPVPLASSFGTLVATKAPLACPQFSGTIDNSDIAKDIRDIINSIPLFNSSSATESEDCLTVNIQRPVGTTASSKLPVVFWIFGGAFELGATYQYNGSSLVKRSANLNAPVIYVSVNYRVGGWGFLAGKELAKEGATNLGLRDQRLALQWVQDNIAAFGGDPAKVTLWGESSGAYSAYDHTIINGGDHTWKGKPLFRGAIMNSGSVLPADVVTSTKAQGIYDTVVKNARCDTATNTLECLRKLNYRDFHDAANGVPFFMSEHALDLSYLPRPDPSNSFFSESPENALKTGKYAKVPVISGNQEDEGTFGALFQRSVDNNDKLVDYFTSIFVGNPNARRDVTGYTSLYPDRPFDGQPDGSPFRTGGQYNYYGEQKRLAAILGDQFILLRRVHQKAIHTKVKTWAYQSTFWNNVFPYASLGTFHGSDIIFSYAWYGENEPLTKTFQTYWISFINYLDPNGLPNTGQNINWPMWDDKSRSLLTLVSGQQSTVLRDDFREAQFQYQLANASQFRL